MRIDPKISIKPVTSEPREPTARPAPRPGSESAVVQLSTAGAAVSEPESTSPNITAKIARIKELVDAGNYHVDLDKLAASIVDDESFRAKAPK